VPQAEIKFVFRTAPIKDLKAGAESGHLLILQMEGHADANMQEEDGDGVDYQATEQAKNKYRNLNDLHHFYSRIEVSTLGF